MILPQTISYRNKTTKQNKQLSNIFRRIHVSCKKCLIAWACLSPSRHLFIHPSTSINLAPTEWTFMKFDTGYFYPHFVKTRKNTAHFTWRPKYIYIVDSNTKYFVVENNAKGTHYCISMEHSTILYCSQQHVAQQYKGNTMLHFKGALSICSYCWHWHM